MSITSKEVTIKELGKLVDHLMSIPYSEGNIIKPIYVWGPPGVGKTHFFKTFCEERNYDFCYVALSQFEETGDLHGIPTIENDVTVFKKPSWVPEPTGRPGILLLDDFNRSDNRLITAVMQLAQLHKLMSWSLPKNWTIVATGNPDHEDFSTTVLDTAVMTRFLHVRLKFDKMDWSKWALKEGIPNDCINFVMSYPELVEKGKLTNARTLTSFFKNISTLTPWLENSELIETIGLGLLDPETVSSFFNFLKNTAAQIPDPETILFSKDTEGLKENLIQLLLHENGVRLDLFSTVFNRLLIRCEKGVEGDFNKENLITLFTIDEIPNDYRTHMYVEWGKLKQENLVNLSTDPRVVDALLKAA